MSGNNLSLTSLQDRLRRLGNGACIAYWNGSYDCEVLSEGLEGGSRQLLGCGETIEAALERGEQRFKELNMRRLDMIINRAELVVSRHEGVHNAHGDLAGLRCWRTNLQDNIPVDWDNVNWLVSQLWKLDQTGVYPK